MRKGCDGEKKREKQGKNGGKKEQRLMIIVATTSLQAVDCPNADRWNAAHSCQFKKHVYEAKLSALIISFRGAEKVSQYLKGLSGYAQI